MKKKLSIYALNLLVMAFAVTGCKGTEETLSPINPIEEKHIHLQEGTLHNVTVTAASRPFVVNGRSEYKIVCGNTPDIIKAVGLLTNHIKKSTGCELEIEIVDDESLYVYNSSEKRIYFGLETIARAAGISKTSEDIGFSGYQINTVGDSIFVQTNSRHGYRFAAIKILEETIGFDCFTTDVYCYEKDGTTLPTMNGVEKSDIDFYVPPAKIDESTSYALGFSSSDNVFYAGIVSQHHNSLQYVPYETYGTAHPKWYASTRDQVCYTAHGDPQEYTELLKTSFEVIKRCLNDNQNCTAITFSIQDNFNICTCEACMANFNKYGSHSGSVVLFINDLDDMVQAYLQDEANKSGTEKRNFNLSFFAYNKTEKAPVVKNADGTYSAKYPEIVCNEHVGPYIAPINASYCNSFYSEENESSAKSVIEGWGAISKNLYLWIYETNFTHYFFPLNSYESSVETYRFLKENNACYMFPEGQWNTSEWSHFTDLKRYITSETAYNVNKDYNTLVDRYFKNVFFEGQDYMKQFYNELVSYLNYLQIEYPFEITGNIYNDIAKAQYWPIQLLKGWLNLTDQALAAVEKYQNTDADKYQLIKKNITIESMFPRFALITLHPGKFSNDELLEMQRSFKEDANNLGMTMSNEASLLSDLFDVWGI